MRTVFLFWRNAHDLKSALFFLFEENLRPVSRFWELWRSKKRFGQNLLRMTWKERVVQFSWKAHCFSALRRIWGQFHEFEKFGAQKCDLAKTCCGDLKKAFCTIFMESALFSSFGENLRPVSRFWELLRSKIRFGQNVLSITWKEPFVQFLWKAHCFLVLARISGQCDDFENLTLKNAISPKSAAHDLKRAFCTIFMKSALFFPFWREFQASVTILKIWRSKMRFGQNVLRMTWKERFVQFSLKVLCFPVLTRISGQGDDFENFDAQKCDLAKKCSAWHEKSVLYNFHGRRTVFSFWREFQARVTILRISTLRNAISPKRAQHYLKRAFCTIFMESALFSRFGENFRPVLRFWEIDAQKCDLAKTCCAWPEKSVLYKFHGKPTVFTYCCKFQSGRAIFGSETLKNAIWLKRPPHCMKSTFCTIFLERLLFSGMGVNFRPVERIWI